MSTSASPGRPLDRRVPEDLSQARHRAAPEHVLRAKGVAPDLVNRERVGQLASA